MTSSIQSGPYEILLRFNCEKGEAFGHLRGCHRIMAGYVVDDAGDIIGKVDTGANAADFPEADLPKYLGDQFSAFTAQLETLRTDKAALLTERDELMSAAEGLKSTIGVMTHENGELQTQLAATGARLSERDAECAELKTMAAKLEVEATELKDSLAAALEPAAT